MVSECKSECDQNSFKISSEGGLNGRGEEDWGVIISVVVKFGCDIPEVVVGRCKLSGPTTREVEVLVRPFRLVIIVWTDFLTFRAVVAEATSLACSAWR